MYAAITNLIQIDKTTKIAILGDMFELGSDSPKPQPKHKHSRSISFRPGMINFTN